MHPTYTKLIMHPVPVTYDDCLYMFNTSSSERPFYKKEGLYLHIGQVVASFIGIPHDEDAYYNQLYDYVHSHGLTLLCESSLKNTEDTDHIQSIQQISRIVKEQSLSIRGFVSKLDDEKLLPTVENFLVNRQIREAAIKMIELYANTEKEWLESKEFYFVLNDVMNWIFHLENDLKKAEPLERMPAFLWYGNYRKSHQFLSCFLIDLGCDLVSFNPAGNDILSIRKQDSVNIILHTFPDISTPKPFPMEMQMKTTTVAFRASKEIEKILDCEGTVIYKPWQLREYIPNAITLKTTYDEMFLVAGEKAMFRPHFDLQKKAVNIPVIFAKVSGVTINRRDYWNRLHSLTLQENTYLVKSLPFAPGANNDFRFHYQKSLDHDGLLNPEKMAGAHFWKYSHLSAGLQKGLATAIRNICANPKLKPRNSEKEDDVKVYLFNQAMQVPEMVLKMLQKFDYSQNVPKLILFNNQLNGSLTRPDSALLLLLNQFGVDIMIYNPAGQSDIENYIDQSAFESHWLEDVVFEQELKEPSVIKKLIFHGISKILRRD
jgi:hypothetical protein